MELLSHFFEPEESGPIAAQISYCCIDINNWIASNNITPDNIVAFNVFLDVNTNEEYDRRKLSIRAGLADCFPSNDRINILAQAPQYHKEIAIEVHAIPPIDSAKVHINKKVLHEVHYTLVEDENDERILFVSGIHHPFRNEDVLNASEVLCQKMENILHAEGMNFSHIFRQWNYIENITKTIETPGDNKQHYQIFNDVRAKYYNHDKFGNGYPAATGIGTRAGGITIGFYAISGSNTLAIPVENPLQIAAFSYSDEVLVGDGTYNERHKNSPKFVRAKYINSSLGSQLFISGTASIRGEKTIGNTGEEQTKITLENIECLFSDDVVKKAGIEKHTSPRIIHLKVYVKDKKYLEGIKKVCLAEFPEVPFLFVYSDVCRDDLLVEIEGIVNI